MNAGKPILHLICGKIASGKSTLARQLAAKPHTILVREDHWLSNLYPDEMKTIQDYVKYSERLRGAFEGHLVSLLESGLSVVLDFPANTVGLRTWMQTLSENAGVEHVLHYLDVPEAVCKERLKRRNRDGTHEFAPSDEQFDLINRYFEPPTEEEGFMIVLHGAD
ncbi:MAG: ATP-binding protein [Rhodospirillales bacterium]|nr:ATP-binding protein [Rhodospirillales bacterium]